MGTQNPPQGHPQSAWRLALAQYLEDTRDPRAAQTWAALGNEFPKDLRVQSAILRARSVQSDRALIRSTII
jgi:hypothetical protein